LQRREREARVSVGGVGDTVDSSQKKTESEYYSEEEEEVKEPVPKRKEERK